MRNHKSVLVQGCLYFLDCLIRCSICVIYFVSVLPILFVIRVEKCQYLSLKNNALCIVNIVQKNLIFFHITFIFIVEMGC